MLRGIILIPLFAHSGLRIYRPVLCESRDWPYAVSAMKDLPDEQDFSRSIERSYTRFDTTAHFSNRKNRNMAKRRQRY